MTPTRIQLSRKKGWRLPDNTIKVDRSSSWGNPYIVGKHGTRAECVELFIHLVNGRICLTTRNQTEQIEWQATAFRALHSLRGKNLACWCPLPKEGEPDLCHAAVLLELANR